MKYGRHKATTVVKPQSKVLHIISVYFQGAMRPLTRTTFEKVDETFGCMVYAESYTLKTILALLFFYTRRRYIPYLFRYRSRGR